MTPDNLKVLFGVVLGDVIFAGGSALLFYASRIDPHAPAEMRVMAVTSLVGIMLALAGGYLAGWIGSRADLVGGVLLAVIIAAGAGVSLISRPGQGAVWPPVAALVLMSPAAMVGDWLRLRTRGKPSR